MCGPWRVDSEFALWKLRVDSNLARERTIPMVAAPSKPREHQGGTSVDPRRLRRPCLRGREKLRADGV